MFSEMKNTELFFFLLKFTKFKEKGKSEKKSQKKRKKKKNANVRQNNSERRCGGVIVIK